MPPVKKKTKVSPDESLLVVLDSEDESSVSVSSDHALGALQKRSLLYEAKEKQVLRIPGSKVAAVAGLNFFSDAADLFLEFLYQDLLELYIHDSTLLLGVEVEAPTVEFVSDEQLRLLLMTQSGYAGDLQEALEAAEAAEDVDSLKTALTKIEDVLQAVGHAAKLVPEEFAQLREQMLKEARCGFGRRHEDAGIRWYEARVGSRVYDEQRSLFLRMPKGGAAVALAQAFPSVATLVVSDGRLAANTASTPVDSNGQPVFAPVFVSLVEANIGSFKKNEPESLNFPASLTSAERKYVHQAAEQAELFSQSLGEGVDRFVKLYRDATAAAADLRKLRDAERIADENTHFKLIGKVDGLVDVSSPGSSMTRTLVVEIKNRTNKIADPPALYDVVQLCTYCRILGCEEGDLAQCLRARSAVAATPTPLSARHASESLHVARLDFRQGSMHRDGWDKHVLPNMYAFADAIYAARQDDNLRYRLLAADALERRSLVQNVCPHLDR